MKRKIVGIIVFMLVTTTMVSATTNNVEENNKGMIISEPFEPTPFDWWNVDQKQTTQNGYGITLIPPETNAQSFTPTKNKLTAIAVYLFAAGAPPDSVHITFSIRDNLTGVDLATETINTSEVTIMSATWVLFDFDDITITPGIKYYIVGSGSAGDANNAYCWLYASTDVYSSGEAWHKATAGSSWIKWPSSATSPADFCFKTYFRKPLDVSSAPQTIPSNPQSCITENWIETQKLIPEDGMAQAQFGGFVSLNGDTVLIGANQDTTTGGFHSGSAYVYVRTGDTWIQQAKLTSLDAAPNDNFGWHLSLDGETALVTAIWDDDNGIDSGSAYIFIRAGTTWIQQAKLIPLDGAAYDHFGYCSALDGDTAYVGANWDDDNGDGSGSLYVFIRNGTTWTQQAKLLASDGQEGDRFGGYIAASGDTALIGAYYDDDNGVDSGSVYVFTRSGTIWTQQQKFYPDDGAAGDTFGQPICIDGDTAIIGSYYDDDKGNDSGSAYVFTSSGTTWTQQAKLLASDGAAGDAFTNYGISLDGDTVLIAACLHDDVGNDSGSAYVFTRTGTTWTQQQKLVASDSAEGDMFAVSVSLDGNTALLGAWYDDDNGVHSGSVYAFIKVGLSFSIAGGIGVKAVVTNNGTSDITDISWQIHVEGGILGMINKTVNGTIDIPAGKSKTVSSGMLFGLGGISIVARVAGMEHIATGTQIIIFSMVK